MKRKTIFIDGQALIEGHFSGVGQYVLGILRGLDEILDQKKVAGEPVPDIRVIIPRDTVPKFRNYQFKHIGYKRFPLPFRYMTGLNHRGLLPPIDLFCGKGHYLFTRFAAMPLWFSSYSAVVYDLSFELYRQFSDEGNAKFLSPRTRATVLGADKVFTISQNAQQEIIDFYEIDPNKVTVATPAADQRYFYRRDEQEIDAAKRKYGITGDYILSLSNLEPRKNLDALIDAYCALPKRITNEVGLLLVGVSGWKTEALFQKIIHKVEEGYNIMRPSRYVDDLDKPAIISGARLLAYPSHYEGFGMPPLEALACGTPVVCADNSSLPEVVGDCAIQIKSTDTAGLMRAIKQALTSDALRKDSIVNGPLQAETFSWEKSARTFYEYLERQAA